MKKLHFTENESELFCSAFGYDIKDLPACEAKKKLAEIRQEIAEYEDWYTAQYGECLPSEEDFDNC